MSETYPPESDQDPGTLPPFDGEPPEPKKLQLHGGFWALGFVMPWFVTWVFASLSETIAEALPNHPRLVAASPVALQVAVLAVLVIAFVWGRRTGDNRLRSFGLGGLTCYVVTVLLGLLVFGACFVLLSGTQLGGG